MAYKYRPPRAEIPPPGSPWLGPITWADEWDRRVREAEAGPDRPAPADTRREQEERRP